MEKLLQILLTLKPLIFAFGFLTPVTAQGLTVLKWTPPYGLSVLGTSVIFCGLWGAIAIVRKGSWL